MILSENYFSFLLSLFFREEVDRQYENFLTKHPDGKISKKEFSQMMRQCYPNADTDKLEKHIFRMYDTNCDGSIDFRSVF